MVQLPDQQSDERDQMRVCIVYYFVIIKLSTPHTAYFVTVVIASIWHAKTDQNNNFGSTLYSDA